MYFQRGNSIFPDELKWNDSLRSCTGGRKFAVTEKGYMAMVPPLTKVGDEIGIVHGTDVPFVFRMCLEPEHKDFKWFQLVGECYARSHGW